MNALTTKLQRVAVRGATSILLLAVHIPVYSITVAADPIDSRTLTGPPNVLMIVVDDMNDWIGCLGGHPSVRTPNIDRLANRGVLFTNAHAAAPVCNPSRAAVMTGRRPSTTGIYGNDVIWHTALPDVTSLPGHFQQHGYHTVGGGKVHHHTPGFNRRSDWNAYFDQVFDGHYQEEQSSGAVAEFRWPPGFPLNGLEAVRELKRPPQNPREFDWGPWQKADTEMGDGLMVEWAVRFLEQPREPFFLATGIFRPHLPFYSPQKYFDMYPPELLSLPPFREDDLDDVPSAGRAMAAQRQGDYDLVINTGRQRELMQAYLAGITYADALVGRLVEALDKTPAGQRTLVVFWSDHGWHLGEKRHLHKFTLWERSTRVPLIVAGAGIQATGQRCAAPAGTIDLFPTLCQLTGLPVPHDIDGISLVPLLQNPTATAQRPALTTHGPGNHALRSQRWRYIRYADGSEELYDHSTDPHEWTNLASSEELTAVRNELSSWLPAADHPPLKPKKKKTP